MKRPRYLWISLTDMTIEYIIPQNPDDRVLLNASKILKEGGLICLPTDTNWVILSDPFSKNGLEKLYKIKKAEKDKHFSLLCQNVSKASDYAFIPDYAFRLIRNKVPGHYTFIFEASKKLRKIIKASKQDQEIGIRFCPVFLVEKLLEVHGNALMSSQVDKKMLGINEDAEVYSYLIEEALGHELGLIIDPGEYDFVGPSTIYTLMEEGPELIRMGAGPAL